MTAIATLVLDFGDETTALDCPRFKLEVPEDEVAIGDEVEIRLWGPPGDLTGWELLRETVSLGVGQRKTTTEVALTEDVSFENEDYAALEWPVNSITRIKTMTNVLKLVDDRPVIWANRKLVQTAKFSKRGFCGIQVKDGTAIYGTARVEYNRVRDYLSWLWTVPADYSGDIWFFLYWHGDLKNAFALELPALASQVLEYKNVTIEMVDHSSEAPLADATIYLGGNVVGTTDSEGRLKLDNKQTGTHLFKATKSGYLDTDLDELSNEEVVI